MTRSWDFLGLNYYQPSGLLKNANYGEDVIIGVVDKVAYGLNHQALTTRVRARAEAVEGRVPDRRGVQRHKLQPEDHRRAVVRRRRQHRRPARGRRPPVGEGHQRPRHAHGLEAAGAPAPNASYGSWLGAGMARGGAPRTRVAVYKACFYGRCRDAAVLAAVDDAIRRRGRAVAVAGDLQRALQYAAGSGKGDHCGVRRREQRPRAGHGAERPALGHHRGLQRHRSVLPDRDIARQQRKAGGQSLYYNAEAANISDYDHLVYGHRCDEKSLESVNITGKIVLCFEPWKGDAMPPKEAFGVALMGAITGGAKGMIFAKHSMNLLEALKNCEGVMSCVLVDEELGYKIAYYASTARTPMAKVSLARSVVGNEVLSPRVAVSSSRGPSTMFPGILKPDIAAPGVGILAANGDSYTFLSGTSMACPHVSAVAALLKSFHPNWSPAMIKSAIITTASTTDRFGMPIQADGAPRKLADPFDFGGGHIDPDRAVDPGLVYDIDPKEYTKFFNCTLETKSDCTSYMGKLYQLYLPSITLSDLKDSVTVWRTVANVGPAKAIYRAKVEAPAGVLMSVEPSVITFNKGGHRSATFKVTFTAKQRVQGGYTFGSLSWLDGCAHSVRIPIAIRTVIQDFVADTS
ncbi:hypothetical protein ACP4OV_028530 [Aristida adscensionis]